MHCTFMTTVFTFNTARATADILDEKGTMEEQSLNNCRQESCFVKIFFLKLFFLFHKRLHGGSVRNMVSFLIVSCSLLYKETFFAKDPFECKCSSTGSPHNTLLGR